MLIIILAQGYWAGIDHTIMEEGYHMIKFQSIYSFSTYRTSNRIINTNPGGNNSYSADYLFQYHAIRRQDMCIPVYRFSGGSCSTTDSKNFYGTSYKNKIKLQYYIKNVCNKSYFLKDDHVMISYYTKGNDLKLVSTFKQKYHQQKLQRKDQPSTMLDLIKKIKDYSYKHPHPSLGDQFLIIGQITEKVPASRVLGLDGLPRLISKKGYGLCFIRYFKRAKISATIVGIGEYFYWAPNDILK